MSSEHLSTSHEQQTPKERVSQETKTELESLLQEMVGSDITSMLKGMIGSLFPSVEEFFKRMGIFPTTQHDSEQAKEEQTLTEKNIENTTATTESEQPKAPEAKENIPGTSVAPKETRTFPGDISLTNQLETPLPLHQVQRLASVRRKHKEKFKHQGYSYIVDPFTMESFVVDSNQAIVQKATVSLGKGFSNVPGSNMTPLGTLRVVEKHGEGTPPGHKPGPWNVWTRVLVMDGLESSSHNARKRGILIHSIDPQREEKLGSMGGSSGCIVTSASEVIQLYNTLPQGTLVEVLPAQQQPLSTHPVS